MFKKSIIVILLITGLIAPVKTYTNSFKNAINIMSDVVKKHPYLSVFSALIVGGYCLARLCAPTNYVTIQCGQDVLMYFKNGTTWGFGGYPKYVINRNEVTDSTAMNTDLAQQINNELDRGASRVDICYIDKKYFGNYNKNPAQYGTFENDSTQKLTIEKIPNKANRLKYYCNNHLKVTKLVTVLRKEQGTFDENELAQKLNDFFTNNGVMVVIK